MGQRKIYFRVFIIFLSGILNTRCSITTPTPPVVTLSPDFPQRTSSPVTPIPTSNPYYVSPSGDDTAPGTLEDPWRTMQKAVDTLMPGDTLFVRGGQYDGVITGWSFKFSGTASQPITITNYPGEQVVFKILTAEHDDRYIFRCSVNPAYPESGQTTKADHIHIIGTDVTPHRLSDGVESQKGIVMQGMEGEQSPAILAADCDYWEVAGVDFIEVAYGIFTKKNNLRTMEEHSPDYWNVHDNRVYIFYRESGMQFNGSFNVIENNEIYKVSDRLDTSFGCQLLNLLGNNNIVRGNVLSRLGSNANCIGLMFEWDLADLNLIENNIISDVPIGISIQGGDGNIIQNNEITASAKESKVGIVVASFDDRITWPCNEPDSISPPENPAHPEYSYYYPHDCHSKNNQILENIITGFTEPWVMRPVSVKSNTFQNNFTSSP